MTSLGVAVLVLLAVLLWPAGHRQARAAAEILKRGPEGGQPGSGPGPGGAPRVSLWQVDPVEALRARRLRRRSSQAEVEALELLDAIAPALRAGLTPRRAFELATTTGIGGSLGSGPGAVGRGTRSSVDQAADFWQAWAVESGSADLAFVASAWRLSESTGAPLAEAVDRAAAQVRSGLSRRRRLSAAIAGPRATVTLLTALPLSGPLFGLACGLSPSAMYLSSATASGSAAVGVLLIVVGRRWCTRIVRTAGAS